MSFKLTKGEDTELSSHVAALRESFGFLETAVEAYNGRMEEIVAELDEAVSAYNSALEDIKSEFQSAIDDYNQCLADALEFASGIAEPAQETFDARSEKWQQGETGEAAQQFLEAWNSLVEELGQDVSFELPDSVEFEAPGGADVAEVTDHADLLENAPLHTE